MNEAQANAVHVACKVSAKIPETKLIAAGIDVMDLKAWGSFETVYSHCLAGMTVSKSLQRDRIKADGRHPAKLIPERPFASAADSGHAKISAPSEWLPISQRLVGLR